MNVELRRPSGSDRVLIRRMMELYLHDFSEFDGSDLDEHGLFGYGDLDYFWFEATHHAFVVTADTRLAGFVLVDDEVFIEGNERSITEFFVLRKYRRQGVGRRVACEVLDRLPAKWEVQVMARNTPAQAFWRKVIAAYTSGAFQEMALDKEGGRWTVFALDNRR